MSLDKSIYKSNLRGTTTPMKFAFYQNQLIDDGLRKSYMFNAVPNKKKQQIRQIIQLGLQGSPSVIRRNQKSIKRNKIFKSVLKTQSNLNKFKVLMSVIKPTKNTFSCCCVDGVRQSVVVLLSQYKQMTIMNRQQTQLLYHFNFNTIQAYAESYDIDPSIFMLDICKKIILKFENMQNQKSQINISQKLKINLQEMIKNSIGYIYKMQNLKQIQNFQKLHYKPVTDFIQNCQTGDLILFRGNMLFAKLQRFVLGSDYDHVGMIYKDPIHGILIFQATSFSGICLSPFQLICKYKWYEFIDRIAWRKLNQIQRDQQFIENCQQLILDKLGTVYNISFDKLMSNKSYIYHVPPSQTKHQNQNQNQPLNKQQINKQQTQQQKKKKKKLEQVGYFCSQLVAKIYKGLQLLTSDQKNQYFKPSCNFYPYHFTQKFPLHLLKGQLSEEYIINFNQEEINDCYQFQR